MNGFKPLFLRDPDGRRRVADDAPFASESSARWWLRLHAAEAVHRGALIRHCGEWRFNPDALTHAAVEIGRSIAEHAARPKDVESANCGRGNCSPVALEPDRSTAD